MAKLTSNLDAGVGHLSRCQITGSSELETIIDLGCQPPCDSLLTAEQLNQPEISYPLRLNFCYESGLAQLDYIVDGSTIYHPDYPYRSGITKELAVYQRAFALDIQKKLAIPKGSFCVDVGSNDGTLLTGFQELGMRTLGIEPTNISQIAERENGIETVQAFFGENLSRNIVSDHGHAQIVTMTNVFAHMANLGDVMRGIHHLLADDGIFISESHYLLDIIEKTQFDTVYHEHIRTYTLKSLQMLCERFDLEVFDVTRADRYGGNIRIYVTHKGKRPVSKNVGDLLKLEVDRGLFKPDTYIRFQSRVFQVRDELMELAYKARRTGARFVGNSCPGRCVPLLNYYGMTVDLMPYIAEQSTSLKLGKFLPGLHIPVVDNNTLIDEQPDYVVLLAWHYAKPIAEQLRARGLKSKFITPLPEVQIIDE
mgnify:CR=1 FL=1